MVLSKGCIVEEIDFSLLEDMKENLINRFGIIRGYNLFLVYLDRKNLYAAWNNYTFKKTINSVK